MKPCRNRAFFRAIFCFLLVPLFGQEAPETALLKKTLLERRAGFYDARVFSPGPQNGGEFSLMVNPQTAPAKGDSEKPVLILAIPAQAGGYGGLSFGAATGLALFDLLDGGGASMNLALRIAFLSAWETAYAKQADYSAENYSPGKDTAEIADFSEDTLLLFLDLPEAPRTVDLYYRAQKAQSPLFMIEPLTALCRAEKIPFRLIKENKPGGERDAGFTVLEFARALEVDAVYLSGSGAPELKGTMSEAIRPEALAGLLLRYLAAIEDTRYNADHGYSAIVLPAGRVFFISEAAKAVLAVAIAGFFLAAAVIFAAGRQITGGQGSTE